MFFGEPGHYLFKMPKAEAEQMTRLPWPALCRHVKRFFPQAWLPELGEIAFFQLGDVEEIFALTGRHDLTEAWEASLPPFFRQPDTQRHFASLHLARVAPEDLRRLMAAFQQNIAVMYKDAIAAAYRQRRWGKETTRRPPEDLDMAGYFVPVPDYPRLTPYFPASPLQVFDILWICKRTDWKRAVLVHVYG